MAVDPIDRDVRKEALLEKYIPLLADLASRNLSDKKVIHNFIEYGLYKKLGYKARFLVPIQIDESSRYSGICMEVNFLIRERTPFD